MVFSAPFRDAYRAQYYLQTLKSCADKLIEVFQEKGLFLGPVPEVLCDFIAQVGVEADQIILPSIAHEVAQAKAAGFLKGTTPEERYISFFEEQQTFTPLAKAVMTTYPFLLDLVDRLIISNFESLELCLNRFLADQKSLGRSLIDKITILSASDRHRGQRAFLLQFKDTQKLIYKPVDLRPDALFSQFIELLNLRFPYDLKSLQTTPKAYYGWIEFIHYQACQKQDECNNFYRRAGVLLAIADALNYTDGHYENLIAMGQYPILLDGETFFQNHSAYPAGKSVLSTLLIQKATSIEQFGTHAALQSFYPVKTEQFYPHALRDHTDELSVSFRGTFNEQTHNCPSFNGSRFSGADFIDELIEGFSIGYDQISEKVPEILANHTWWAEVAKVRTRVVLRRTVDYAYCLKRIQQPDVCSSRDTAKNIIASTLKNNRFREYEIADLLDLNFPIFYQYPGERHFYDGHEKKYDNEFSKTAVQNMQQQLRQRSIERKAMNISVIEGHLKRVAKHYELVSHAT